MEKKRATSIGFAAIILWSTMVGLIRGVSEGLGPVGGAAMIYSLSGLLHGDREICQRQKWDYALRLINGTDPVAEIFRQRSAADAVQLAGGH